MWIALAAVLVLFPAGLALVRARRWRLRGRRMLLGELADFAKLVADPARAADVVFTGPHRSDQDRAHDTMFTARHGHRQLSFILDTSGWRVRWWVLYELRAPETSARSLRVEATFISGAIPVEPIRDLLKAARAAASAPPAPKKPPPEVRVDPFEAPDPESTVPAVQA